MSKNNRYILGLDIGITSVGWSVLNLDKERIEDLGVRIFDAAENPKTGASLALPRRTARSRRRLLRRKKYRINRVKKLLVQYSIISQKELDILYSTITGKDVWEARAYGLDQSLTNLEWARVLISFAKRRGFKSNRKNEIKDKDLGPLLKSIQENITKMDEAGYRTFGEMLYKEANLSGDPSFSLRNKDGKYTNGILRSVLEEEIKLLFEAQRALGNEFASEEIEKKYLDIFNSQRPYSDFETLESFVGYCTFEKNNKIKRAPKHSISAEEFTLYTDINKLSIVNKGFKRKLTEEERDIIVQAAFKSEIVKYTSLRKLLSLEESDRFSTLNYSLDKDCSKTENTKFVSLKGYHEIRKAVSKNLSTNYWNSIKNNRELLNDLAYVLSLAKTDEQIKTNLVIRGVDEELIEAVINLSFSKFNNLSVVAIEKILPYLKAGLVYSEACTKAGYDFKAIYKGIRYKKLPLIEIDEIINPVVCRALAQARKVVNAVIDRYGSPEKIHIELARDIAKNKIERNKINKKQKNNKNERDKVKEELMEILGDNIEPTGSELLKYRLWKQQNEECAYTQSKISINDLFKAGFYETDHILPYSRTFDDTLNNKILVKAEENRRKSDKTPYEYFGHDETRWNRFTIWVESSNLSYGKKNNLLKKNFTEEEGKKFKQRNINDTGYIAKYLANFINEKLEFSHSESKRKVITINGQATAYLRSRWGLSKTREDDLHHALDASVVAAANQSIINKISIYNKAYELKYTEPSGEIIDTDTGEVLNANDLAKLRKERFPMIWPEFSSELKVRMASDPIFELTNNPIKAYDEDFIKNQLRPIFVSKMPKRKVTGALFEETIYPVNNIKNGKTITKKKLVNLTEEDFNNIYNYNSDKKLYDALYDKFLQFGKDAKKAFGEEPFRKPTKSGKIGPIVNSIKIMVNKAVAKDFITFDKKEGNFKRGDMVRIDIYEKDEKYYIVPVYSYQILSNNIPKKAAFAGKAENEWVDINDSYTFRMALFKNDLIKISYKKKPGYFGYYTSFNRANVSLNLSSHDGAIKFESIGIKTNVTALEKYNVDVLGYYSLIKK